MRGVVGEGTAIERRPPPGSNERTDMAKVMERARTRQAEERKEKDKLWAKKVCNEALFVPWSGALWQLMALLIMWQAAAAAEAKTRAMEEEAARLEALLASATKALPGDNADSPGSVGAESQQAVLHKLATAVTNPTLRKSFPKAQRSRAYPGSTTGVVLPKIV